MPRDNELAVSRTLKRTEHPRKGQGPWWTARVAIGATVAVVQGNGEGSKPSVAANRAVCNALDELERHHRRGR